MTAAILYALGVATGLVAAYCIVVFIAWREYRAESRGSRIGFRELFDISREGRGNDSEG